MEAQNEVVEEIKPMQRSYKRLWCAMASAVVPGLGDWFLGNKRRAVTFFALFVLVLLCYWPLRLAHIFWALLVMLFGGCALNIFSSCFTFLAKRERKDAGANWWLVVVVAVALFIGSKEASLALIASGFRVFDVPSGSMEPVISINDKIVVDMWFFRRNRPEQGEIVVFQHHGSLLVKRIIAIGGSTISSKDNLIEVDGKPVAEPYVIHRMPDTVFDEMKDFGPLQVSEGQIFVMGDNRDQSLDSRARTSEDIFGPVLTTDLAGKPLYYFKSNVSPMRNGQKIN